MDGTKNKILVLNAGSSSVKYKLFAFDVENKRNHETIAEGKIEKIGESISKISFKKHTNNKEEFNEEKEIKDHHHASKEIIDALKKFVFVYHEGERELFAIGHRVVHGGGIPDFNKPAKIDDERKVVQRLRDLIPLAPLHIPGNLDAIEATKKLFHSSINHYIVCDTAFHCHLPPTAYHYAVPDNWYKDLNIRRFGFHGISHLFVGKEASLFLGKKFEEAKLITIHLGNGCSVACIKNGRSVDTSMGFTPLEGLVMGTRSGSVDPGVLEYLSTHKKKDIVEVVKILNHDSGLKGFCGTGDMRDVVSKMKQGDEKAKLAFEIFCYSIRKFIGEYFVVLGCQVDAIVFTGGIGENSSEVRSSVLTNLESIGVMLDIDNNRNQEENMWQITKDLDIPLGLGCIKKCLVVKTNEELEIARQVVDCMTQGMSPQE